VQPFADPRPTENYVMLGAHSRRACGAVLAPADQPSQLQDTERIAGPGITSAWVVADAVSGAFQ